MSLRVRKNRVGLPAGIAVPPEVRARSGGKRNAEDCPLNRVMDLLSGAWAPHVVWYLSAQPRRFGELRIDIPAISARVLSQRLRELEAKRVVTRTVMPTSPPSTEYALTELGHELVPALAAIAAVGTKLANAPPRAKRARGRVRS
jgi:DNA-binding HxlR family transcriptional regulator